MTPKVEDGWSDSEGDDDDVLSEIETSVLLGIPDGPITTTSDTKDAAVSRIGGCPVRVNVPFLYRIDFLTCFHIYEGISFFV